MPIEKAPYIRYYEETSIVPYGSVDADIPVFIAPSEVFEPTKIFPLTDDLEGLDENDEVTTIEEDMVKVVKKNDHNIIVYIKDEDGYVIDYVTQTYKKVPTPPTVDTDHLYLYNNIDAVKEDIVSERLIEVIEDFFTENKYYMNESMGSSYIYVIPLPPGDGLPVGKEFTKALSLLKLRKEITSIVIVDLGILSTQVELKGFLNEEAEKAHLRIAYYESPVNNETESIVNGKIKSKYEKYADVILEINQVVNSSRIAVVEREFFGKHIAKIANTQYYVEPGYLPYYSVNTGEFLQLNEDERDALCMAGLIFGEDDYTLEYPVPRMCLGVSSAFGKHSSDYRTRTTDSLLHARRNVDHHVRELIKIIAPQIKRNETSTTLRSVQDLALAYLNTEYGKGTIMEYEFSVSESTVNPYCLIIRGKITPVNSTLAIEFYNVIGSPLSVSSYSERSSPSPSPSEPTHDMSITVTDENDEPVEDATVILEDGD